MNDTSDVDNSVVAQQDDAALGVQLDDGDLGKIQALLFGSQLSAINERLTRLEQKLDERVNHVHSELHQHVDRLSTAQQDENDSLRLEVDQVRQQLISSDDAQESAYTELMKLIQELKTKKLDRASLAGLLGDVAQRIDDE